MRPAPASDAGGGVGVGRQGVDDDDGVAVLGHVGDLRRPGAADERGQGDDERAGRGRPDPHGVGAVVGAGLGDDERLEQAAQVAPSAADRHVAHPPAEVDEPDPVAGPQEVLGDGGRRPHGDVEAAGRAVDALAAADVGLGVEQQQDVGVAVGPRRRDVQRHRSATRPRQLMRRSRSPVRNGRTSAGSLPPPWRFARCRPDQPGRPGHGVGGVELGAERQRRQRRPDRRPRPSVR